MPKKPRPVKPAKPLPPARPQRGEDFAGLVKTGHGGASAIDDPKLRGVLVGAIAAGASNLIAASIAMASGFKNVTEEMVADRRLNDPAFKEECDNAVGRSDALVAMSLFTKATRGEDVTAMIFWLKNRQPHLWRDRKELEVNIPDIPGTLRSAAERARERRRRLMESIRTDAIPVEVTSLVPFEPGGNGHGGNGHG